MILLTFDVEEFDTPIEYGSEIDISEQISLSTLGLLRVLDLCREEGVPATFFCTANFALQASGAVRSILDGPHELASHGYFHSTFEEADLLRSKVALEEFSGTEILGYRMARMAPLSQAAVAAAGYKYNSSINPTFIPGRYNSFGLLRVPFREAGIWQIPASVTPWVRFPLFWLSFHNLPPSLYRMLCRWTWRHDGNLSLYFHPWEFAPLGDQRLRLPGYIKRCSDMAAIERLRGLIRFFQRRGCAFGLMRDRWAELENQAT